MKNTSVFIAMTALLLGCSSNDDSNRNFGYVPSSWSSAKVVSLCDSTKINLSSQELVVHNSGKTYYNKQVKRSEHEIKVRFDFISECCREFEIEHQITEGRLIIQYKPKSGELCECKCTYRGLVNIGDNQVNFREIGRVVIVRSE